MLRITALLFLGRCFLFDVKFGLLSIGKLYFGSQIFDEFIRIVLLICLELGFERNFVYSLINRLFFNQFLRILIILLLVHGFIDLSLIQQPFQRLFLGRFVGFHWILVFNFIKVVWRFDGYFLFLIFFVFIFGQSRFDVNDLLYVIARVFFSLLLLNGSCNRSLLVWYMFLTATMDFTWNLINIVFQIKARFDLLLLFNEILHFGLRATMMRLLGLSRRFVGLHFDLFDSLLSFPVVTSNRFNFFQELIGFLDTLLYEFLGLFLLLFGGDELLHLLLNNFVVFFC